jgi:hypothetical protein
LHGEYTLQEDDPPVDDETEITRVRGKILHLKQSNTTLTFLVLLKSTVPDFMTAPVRRQIAVSNPPSSSASSELPLARFTMP